jgi:uncharacterized damage-inducible protein DinB
MPLELGIDTGTRIMNETERLGKSFLEQARSLLSQDFMPKIRKCLDLIETEDVWWRADETNNSIGNLILHLCGNLHQWIISGLGGEPDLRRRSREFSERDHVPKEELLARLDETLQEADRVLASFDANDLLVERTIQGFRKTVLEAIFHVVEHFSFHTGQIIYITKLRKKVDLKFYDL